MASQIMIMRDETPISHRKTDKRVWFLLSSAVCGVACCRPRAVISRPCGLAISTHVHCATPMEQQAAGVRARMGKPSVQVAPSPSFHRGGHTIAACVLTTRSSVGVGQPTGRPTCLKALHIATCHVASCTRVRCIIPLPPRHAGV